MPGPWIERETIAFKETEEWYESNLSQNTEYEVQVSFDEDFSRFGRGSFRTARTDNDVTLRSVTITPQDQPPITFADIDFTRETDGAGSGVYSHRLNVLLDQPRNATVTAVAMQSSARVVIEPNTIAIAAGLFPQFTVTITNGTASRVYRFTVLSTVPELLEFDNASQATLEWDITSDGTSTMWVGDRDRGIHTYDFNTKAYLGFTAIRNLEGIAYDNTNRTLWYSNGGRTVTEVDPNNRYSATGRTIRMNGNCQFLDWHDDILYAKRVANDGLWLTGNTSTLLVGANVNLAGVSSSAGQMWRDDNNYFTINGINPRGAFRVYNTDLTRNMELEARFSEALLDDLNSSGSRGIWGNDTHIFVLTRDDSRSPFRISAFNRLTGTRDITIGANFRRPNDFQMRSAGVRNPVDLWGNSSTMWVLNNDIEETEFTGDVTKLFAFDRTTRLPIPRLDIEIEDVVPTGQGVTGNSTHIWVLADGWLRAWTHGGVRSSRQDVRVVEGATAVHLDSSGVFWVSYSDGVIAYNSAGGEQDVDKGTWAEIFPFAFNGLTMDPYVSEDTDGYALNGLVLQNIKHILRPAIPERINVLLQRLVIYYSCVQAEEPNEEGLTPVTCTALSYSVNQTITDSCTAFDTGISTGGGALEPGIATSARRIIVSCHPADPSPAIPAHPGWALSSTLDLEDNGFTQTSGMFRDGNSLWVIEQPISVAAHFTIQDDGTIVRS